MHEARLRRRTRLVVQGVLSLALVVVIFRYLLGGIDLAEVWAEITAMTSLELAGLLAIVAWNLATMRWSRSRPACRSGAS